MVSGSGSMMLGHNSMNVECKFCLQRAGKDVLEEEPDSELDDGCAWLDEFFSILTR